MTDSQEMTQLQTERTERAQSALVAGRFQVIRVDPLQWTVRNGDNLPYTVSLHGETWSCTCPDFLQIGPAIRCKHIEGVRLLEETDYTSNSNQDKEVHLEEIPNSSEHTREDKLSWILRELRQPLDMTRVKRRQAPGSGTVPYLEGHSIIDRANGIFDFAWSFEVISTPEIVRWHKKVLVWNDQEKKKILQMDENGITQTEEVGLVYITGKVTVDLDGTSICHADLGRCIFSGDTPEALDMALAGAVTDCLKRCFRQMGDQFGNNLYDKDISQPGQFNRTTGTNRPQPSQTNHPIMRKYTDGIQVNGNTSEQEAFDQYKTKTGKIPASREVLRAWISSQAHSSVPTSVVA